MANAHMSALKLQTRIPLAGPETNLLDTALSSGISIDSKQPIRLFREPQLPTGFPDAVAVYLRTKPVPVVPSRVRITTPHLRLLHHLYFFRGDTFENVANLLVIHHEKVECLVEDLVDACLVTIRGRRVIPRPLSHIFAVQRIVAIEAKIKNWRHALHQASANIWFASHSYVLLPPHRNLARITQEARIRGVGVMICDGTRTSTVLKAHRYRIPASYGSWLFNEWTVQKVYM